MRYLATALLWVGIGPSVWLLLDDGYQSQAVVYGLVAFILSTWMLADSKKGE